MNVKANFRGTCSICGKYAFLVDGCCLDCYPLKNNPCKWDHLISIDEFYKKILYLRSKRDYTEIVKLHILLTDAGIPHTLNMSHDGYQICYPSKGKRILSVIEHSGSYGSEDDLLEIQGLLTPQERENDGVLGRLTAVDVLERIWEHLRKEGTV